MKKRVLDVGQCPPDHSAIRHLMESLGAEVQQVALPSEAVNVLKQESFDLVLVNRKIDQDYTDGIELVTMMKQNEIAVPVMLVSNYADAQAQAVSMGAVQGFGKDQLRLPETKDRILSVLQSGVPG
jgi:CheY-like chemotaxis protein